MRARTTRLRRPRKMPHVDRHIRVHRNSAPRFVTTRNAPHAGAERKRPYAKSEFLKTGIFLWRALDRVFRVAGGGGLDPCRYAGCSPRRFPVVSLHDKKGQLVMAEKSTVSRRHALTIATGLAGASIAGTAIDACTSAAYAGLSQKAVKYQNTPHGAQRCDTCANWLPPLACKVVDGTVVASGWCTSWVKGSRG
jgi:hypothetical protein